MLSKYLAVAALALPLATLSAPASAGPSGALVGANVGEKSAAVDQVDYRRCWYEDGVRHCRRVVTPYYSYDDDGYYDDGYYGYGPGINLRFGGGHGHFGGGHGHGHR